MSVFSKIKNVFAPKHEPLVCKPSGVFELIRQCVDINAPPCGLVVEINGKTHKIGVASDYDSRTDKYFDVEFYFDDMEFASLPELIEKAQTDNVRVAELGTITVLEDEDGGDPRNNALLAEREIKFSTGERYDL